METIKFSMQTNFTGRNGFMKCSGVEIMDSGNKDKIILSPLTSRGHVGRCDIFIPKADIPALVKLIERFTSNKDSINGTIALGLIKGINWDLLKVQKSHLLNLPDSYSEALQGIITLIDTLQDFAVDELQLPEDEIFDL